jgi:type IV pilus assembly protein PilA
MAINTWRYAHPRTTRPADRHCTACLTVTAPCASAIAGASRLPLLLGIVVIALLVAVAIPAWQDHTVRGRVTDVLGAAAEATVRLSGYVATQGELPVPADPALPAVLAAARAPDRIADAAWSSDGGGVGATGVLALTLAEADDLGAMRGATILLTATVIGGRQVTWSCAPRDPELARFLPPACGDLFE